MIWKARVTQLTKTKYPLIMAAFARYGKTNFAASFSNAGGLGTITSMGYEIKQFKDELKRMNDLTDKRWSQVEESRYIELKNNPFLNNLRSDARFQHILTKHKALYEKNLAKYGDVDI